MKNVRLLFGMFAVEMQSRMALRSSLSCWCSFLGCTLRSLAVLVQAPQGGSTVENPLETRLEPSRSKSRGQAS